MKCIENKLVTWKDYEYHHKKTLPLTSWINASKLPIRLEDVAFGIILLMTLELPLFWLGNWECKCECPQGCVKVLCAFCLCFLTHCTYVLLTDGMLMSIQKLSPIHGDLGLIVWVCIWGWVERNNKWVIWSVQAHCESQNCIVCADNHTNVLNPGCHSLRTRDMSPNHMTSGCEPIPPR